MVTQEHRPLTGVRNIRRLPHDVGDGMPVFGGDRHVNARHQRKMERHVAFVARSEVLQHVFGPLIGLGEQHAVAIVHIKLAPQPLQDLMGFGQVFVYRALALDQIRHCVETHSVDPQIEPKAHNVGNRAENSRIVEV